MKNKMKKIFSKITILVLLVAMLVPYTSIPKVEAATETECNGEWEYHTNFYFFLEADHPHTWASNFSNVSKDGSSEYTSNFYTSFLYNFPSNGSAIEFDEKNSGFVNLKASDADEDYNENFNPVTDKWTPAQFYYEYIKEGNGASGDYQSYSYSFDNNKGTSSSDSIVTYLYHGPWANAGNSSTINLNNKGKLDFIAGGVELDTTTKKSSHISKLVDATIYLNRGASTISNAKIAYSQTGSTSNIDYSLSGIKSQIDLFNSTKGQTSIGDIINKNNGNPIITLLISRTYEISDIFTNNLSSALGADEIDDVILKNETYQGGDGFGFNTGIYAYDKDDTTAGKGFMLHFPGHSYKTNTANGEITVEKDGNSKIGYSKGNNEPELGDASYQTSYTLNTTYNNNSTDWFFAPTLYKISYKVCKDAGSPEGKVTLSYDGNEEYVKSSDKADKVPSSEQKDKGSDFTIPETKPELKDYTFKEWNNSSKCDGTSYEPGYTIEDLKNDTTLYACWGSTSGTKNGKTGVLTYTGLFAGIIALAGGSYYIMKKKNLFKQI